MSTLEFQPAGRSGPASLGETLREAARRLGVSLRQVCGGQASCTTCRVRVLEGAQHLTPAQERERRRLPDERLEQGWRLACQARLLANGPVRVQVPGLADWLGEERQ